ncbi:hypothetical protein PHJA_000987600, partial [Phtheirospermum japonicum]
SAAAALSFAAAPILRLAEKALLSSYILFTFSLTALTSFATPMSFTGPEKALCMKFETLISSSRFVNAAIKSSSSSLSAMLAAVSENRFEESIVLKYLNLNFGGTNQIGIVNQ